MSNKFEEKSLNEIYTQLAREGKFDKLPDTCEFSEPVELEVWDEDITNHELRTVFGKFKGKYIAQNIYRPNQYLSWNYAQLPTKKIDFSQFKAGDVVEVETKDNTTKVGYIYSIGGNSIEIAPVKNKSGLSINKTEIKSITKIK